MCWRIALEITNGEFSDGVVHHEAAELGNQLAQ
jgi:hypothetical protein